MRSCWLLCSRNIVLFTFAFQCLKFLFAPLPFYTSSPFTAWCVFIQSNVGPSLVSGSQITLYVFGLLVSVDKYKTVVPVVLATFIFGVYFPPSNVSVSNSYLLFYLLTVHSTMFPPPTQSNSLHLVCLSSIAPTIPDLRLPSYVCWLLSVGWPVQWFFLAVTITFPKRETAMLVMLHNGSQNLVTDLHLPGVGSLGCQCFSLL